MTLTAAETAAREQVSSGRQAKPLLLDVDVHPLFLPRDILPRMPERWRTRYANENSGRGGARGIADYPRWRNGGFRIDAAVPGGGPAGSDLDLMRTQLLAEDDNHIASVTAL